MSNDALTRARAIMMRDLEDTLELSRQTAEGIFNHLAQKCQSPIEVLMLGALAYGLDRVVDSRQRAFPSFCARSNLAEGVLLRPQEQIGPYRVDFALTYTLCHFPGSPGVFTKVNVVIECDGHDYHNITKEQAQRDRERDRYLQQCGWSVLRFTGTEIYRSPQHCADQVAAFLSQETSRLASIQAGEGVDG